MVLLHLSRRRVELARMLPLLQQQQPGFPCCRRRAATSGSAKHRPDRQTLENLGSWNTTTLSIDYEKSAEGGRLIPKIDLSAVGISCIVNKRRYNEDRYLAKTLASPVSLADETVLCAAVFDGHGGALAADFTSTTMAQCIERNLKTDENIERVLRQSFIDVNSAFVEFVKRSTHTGRGRGPEQYSGTTSVVCLLIGGEQLYTAHVGDSRALLCRLAAAYPLTHDHDPDRLDERRRVEAAGGVLATNSLGRPLVEGKLSMTRSIGDLHLKRCGVIAEPEISHIRIKHHKDAFIILVTDGVTFSISNQETVDAVLSVAVDPASGRPAGTAQQAAEAVTQRAARLGSSDNCTALVIPLGMWGRLQAGVSVDACMPFEFGRMLSSKFNES